MKVGIGFANIGPFGTAEGGVAMARAAEEAGIDSLWTVAVSYTHLRAHET